MVFKDKYPVLSASIKAVFKHQDQDCPDLDGILGQEEDWLYRLETLADSLIPAEREWMILGDEAYQYQALLKAQPELQELDQFLQAVWEERASFRKD